MLKLCLASQLYANYIAKNYFTNGLLSQDHSLRFHNFFIMFSEPVLLQDFLGTENRKINVRTFQDSWKL